ncbi:AAA family ATPase [uncultured Aliiroseovarius sp.]|uniref:AAA family ATPase n=1 Tax=uncultured Aliiroseovarius sp. TaxID=1658783 RepID=UPI00262AEF72|nr:AAA family ATPase [uncultured Aliiroseovarius sp.]
MFTNKYAPQVFDDLVFQNDTDRKKLQKHATGERVGNILLHGPYGSGKSTVARIVASQSRQPVSAGFEMEYDSYNGAEFEAGNLQLIERGWNLSGQRYAYAVLDEFDLVHPSVQAKVRAVMDRYSDKHGFIFTTNHLHRVDAAIQSRCTNIEMPALSSEKLLPLCRHMLRQEQVMLADEDILTAIQFERGNIRNVLRQLEDIVDRVREANAA